MTTKDSYEHLSIKMLDSQGGCCDCEILYDVVEFSRLNDLKPTTGAIGQDVRMHVPNTFQ